MKYLKMYMVMLMGVTITEFSFADIARWTDPETGLEWTYWEYPSYSDWHDRVSIGGGDNTVPALPRTTSGRVIIPSEIAGKRVFDVGFHAFAYCDKITSIVIPPSVNSISASAFLGCSALSSVGLPEGLKTIDMYAFKDCIQLKDLEFPATIVEIGPEAFENCKEIDRVELPDGIERIGGFEYYTISESAFRGCTGIRDVSIAKSLSVGKLFGSCYTAITNVTVRGGEQIGPQDFKECAQLERVFLPHGLQSIGTEAFYKCKKLTELHIPATVTNISAAAFEYCECVHELVLPECLSEIGREAFGYCTGLVSVTMPTHLDKIENDLFIDCNALSEVNIRDLNGWCSQDFPFFRANPLHYAHNGFVNNVCLTNLEIPNGTERIGTYAFSGVNVAFVLVPQSVKVIASAAFASTAVKRVVVPWDTNVADNAFEKSVCIAHPVNIQVCGCERSVVYDGSEKLFEYEMASDRPEYRVKDNMQIKGMTAGKDCGLYSTFLSHGLFQNTNDHYEVSVNVDPDHDLCSMVIERRPVTVTAASAQKSFDGLPLMNADVMIGGDGFVEGECIAEALGFQTNVGASENAVVLEWAAGALESNYSIVTNEGTLTVIPAKVAKDGAEPGAGAILSGGVSKFDGEAVKYDGSGHTINVAALEEVTLVADTPVFSYSLTSNGVYRSEPYCFTNACVTSFWYKISAANYEDYVHEARVTILPREVTLTSGSASRYYNGEPLTRESFEVSDDGFVGADGVVVSYSGAQTNPGISDNEFSYVFNEGTVADNYTITQQYGKLEVWALKKMFEDGEPTERTVPAAGVSKFDGEPVKYDGEGHTINVAALEQVTLVGDTPTFSYSLTRNGVYRSEPYYFTNASAASMWYKISAPNYKDYVHEARVTILPREVTLASGSASKNFDGTALRCEKIEVADDGFVGADGVNAVYSGSQLWLGTSKNTFDYSFKLGTIGTNYQITKACGDLTVTATGTVVVDDSITRIPAEAFKDCVDLTAVVLSENVTEIGANAFAGCTKLKRITFPTNMEIRRSRLYEWGLTDDFIAGYRVGDFIVINTTVLEYVGDKSVTSLTIPNGTTVIDDDALAGLDNLASVTFAGTERVLGARAFKDGVSLEAVGLPVTLEEIGTGAFENCTWMNRASVDGGTTFPENLRRVGARAFYNCMELTSVVLPEGVCDIGDNAFYNCRGLISASLPHSLTNIGETAFGKCAKLAGVTVPTGLKPLSEIFPDGFCKVSSVTIPDGETEIVDEMFKDCEGVTRFVIPMSVADVGRAAFENCAALQSLALPDDIVSIGSAAFKDCGTLSVVSLPKNLMVIADGLFECCSSLEAVIVPASVASLGSYIFKESAVTEVKFLGNAPDYDDFAYDGTGNLTSYIVRGSTGWDYAETGIRTSRQKPDLWIGKAIEYWSPNIFEVTFDGNGGTPETYVAEQITDTTYSLPKVNPTRDGYVFKGWWTEPIAGGEVTANTICVANREHALYAHWEAGATVEVSFNPCGGTVTPDVRSYVSGTTYGGFPVATRRGYRFQGWFTAAEHGEKVKEANRVPSVATTLYAQWKPVVYEVEFHANNGTTTTALQDFTFGEPAALRANDFTWGEHDFIGWAKSPGGAVEFADKDVVLNLSELDAEDGGVVCLYARWSGASYAVRFDGNGGAGHMDNETFMTGLAQAIDENAFTREGYVFSGWARTTTGDVAYGDGEVIQDIVESGTVVLYAVWTTVGSARITVRFVPGEGATSELVSKEYEVGLKYGALPGATLKGYAMVGWFTAQTGGVLAGATSNVTAHTTLYAHWTPITYRVSFDGNEGAGNMPLQTFTYDQEQTLDRCTFVRSGYDFVGWSNLASGDVIYADGQPVKNLTATPNLTVPLYAVWQKTSGGPVVPPVEPPEEPEEPVAEPVVTNTITYVNLQGAANTNVTTFTTNDLPLVLGPVEREGWRFLGWMPQGGVIPAGTVTNVTFAAQWEEIVEPPVPPVVEPVVTNMIAYLDLEGAANPNPATFTTNDLPLVLGPVEREGWRFLGWTPLGGVIPAGTVTNVTFAATWEEIVEPPPVEPPPLEPPEKPEQPVESPEESIDPSEDHEPPVGPGQPTNTPPTVVVEAETHVDVAKGGKAPYEDAAAVYDGYLYDGEKVVGSVQVKVARGKIDKKSGVFSAKVTATVQLAGEAKKLSFKGGNADQSGNVSEMTDKNNHKLAVTVGVKGLGGTFDGKYKIDGARNVFSGKSDVDKSAAEKAMQAYMATYNVAFDGGTLSVAVGKKGKVKVSGTVNGNKVSATSQLVVGDGAAVVPVVIVKKANVAFCLWIDAKGGVGVHGVDSVTSGEDAASPFWEAGKVGAIADGAKFWLDEAAVGKMKGWLMGLYADYLPKGLAIAQSGKKWIVAGGAKAGKLVLNKTTGTLDLNKSKITSNTSGLKLTYKEKDGTFKGSFKAYNQESGKIKSYTASVAGVMIGDTGYGTATIKKLGTVAVVISKDAPVEDEPDTPTEEPAQPAEEPARPAEESGEESSLGGVQLWEDGPFWAECNVGATKPEEYGYYFWWGDTVGYKRNASGDGWVSVKDETDFSFSSGNCSTFDKSDSQLQSEGYIDATGNLVAAHDAATAHLGAPWRMPTDAEFDALIDNCDTEWTSRNGVPGRLVKGRGAYASKSIFLPAAGLGNDSDLYYLGSHGYFWSSMPYSDDSYYAWSLSFGSGNFSRYFNDRDFGRSVRPVRGFAK